MNPEVVNRLISSLFLMKSFPLDPAARVALFEVLGDMCESEDQVRWLVKELRVRYAEWPGEQEMRRLFCRYFRSHDGIVVSRGSDDACNEVYAFTLREGQRWPPPGIQEQPAIPLPAGSTSADKKLDAQVKQLAQRKILDPRERK